MEGNAVEGILPYLPILTTSMFAHMVTTARNVSKSSFPHLLHIKHTTPSPRSAPSQPPPYPLPTPEIVMGRYWDTNKAIVDALFWKGEYMYQLCQKTSVHREDKGYTNMVDHLTRSQKRKRQQSSEEVLVM
jgi:hypothetical protein